MTTTPNEKQMYFNEGKLYLKINNCIYLNFALNLWIMKHLTWGEITKTWGNKAVHTWLINYKIIKFRLFDKSRMFCKINLVENSLVAKWNDNLTFLLKILFDIPDILWQFV